MQKMVDAIVTKMFHEGEIAEDELELYQFGLRQAFWTLISLVGTVLIGAFFHMVPEVLAFLLAFTVLRPYAGGYHAGTHLRCTFLSMALVVAVCFAGKLFYFNSSAALSMIVILLAFLFGVAVWLLAPVEDANKPLDEMEVRVYRNRARAALLILWFCTVLLFAFQLPAFSFMVSLAIIVISVSLMAGKIKNAKT